MSAAPAATDGHSRGGTGQHTSPGTPSSTRLVTMTRSPATAVSSLRDEARGLFAE